MQVLSYRGPSAPGGVSSTLTQIWERHQLKGWWFVRDSNLQCKLRHANEVSYTLDSAVQTKHYRYCNNFLWPILHDLPQFAKYTEEERLCYKAFNSAVAFRIKSADKISFDGLFVNDYQFALIPTLLKSSNNSFVFWHIPWPKQVRPEHVNALSEVAVGLLHAKVVGFHTREYMQNFFRFVEANVPHVKTCSITQTVKMIERASVSQHSTQFIVAPLGIDQQRWQELALSSRRTREYQSPYILSVDRADYTKGIRERLVAIEHFFIKYPEWQRKVFFLQLGTRSRQGLPAFDRYWQECRERASALTTPHRSDSWQPLVWTESPRSASELASLYSKAAVMLVSPLRDGLNLTAKEFAGCLTSNPGVLALSKGAGVWNELGHDSTLIEPTNPDSFADAIARSLTMSDEEKAHRAQALKNCLAKNSLAFWWQSFQQMCDSSKSNGLLEKVCS